MLQPRHVFQVLPQYQPLVRMVGLDAETIFTHPRIVAWRKLSDRENCTLDAEMDGKKIRLHIKRYANPGAANEEVNGIHLLEADGIATLQLVGWGKSQGRSFVISADLAGYQAADKLIASGGATFESVLNSTADLAAKLHRCGLHHRDLYLCHFFVKGDDVRLIDAARVARLGNRFSRSRWSIKDLAQFWYSTMALAVSDEQRDRWLARYGGLALKSSILRKVQ